jgi:16S rRNA (adenine1518-N6/adenine1519-N6)-dimethyltransferase
VLERIAAEVRAARPQTIVEIGPGQGALTQLLLESGAQVHAVELDPLMIVALERRFPAHPRLHVHHRDVLDTDLAQWGPAALAGNLPYYITSPILERIFAASAAIQTAVLLMQKEVADRLAAAPSSRDYGYLSVTTQTRAAVEKIMTVPPGAFRPPPKVDSAVVRLTLQDQQPAPEFLHFVSLAFKQKRKTLRNNLQQAYPNAGWAELPERGLRAEQLSIAQLCELHAKLS